MALRSDRRRIADTTRRRLGAHLLDWVDEPVVAVWTVVCLGELGRLGVVLAGGWLVWIVLQLARQARTGQTAGKHCLQLAVLDASTGRPLGPRRTAIRWLAHSIDTLLPLAWVRSLLGSEVRTFADLVARSTVVDLRLTGEASCG